MAHIKTPKGQPTRRQLQKELRHNLKGTPSQLDRQIPDDVWTAYVKELIEDGQIPNSVYYTRPIDRN